MRTRFTACSSELEGWRQKFSFQVENYSNMLFLLKAEKAVREYGIISLSVSKQPLETVVGKD